METTDVISNEIYKSIFNNEDLYLIENKPIESKITEESQEKTDLIEVNIPELETDTTSKISIEKKNETVPEPIKIEENKKEIPLLLLANDISVAEKVFLEKVLNAVNLSLDEIEIFTNNDLQKSDFKTFATGKTYQRIISFGLPYSKIGISKMFVPYQITIIKNIQFLMAELLPVVENDLAHKRIFWACLKQMFNQN